MRTKQTLAIAIVFGLALASSVFANVSYDNEVTNEWFSVDVSEANLTQHPPWTAPSNGGSAVVNPTSGKIQRNQL